MTWIIAENQLGVPSFTSVDTEAKLPLGSIVRGYSKTYGAGEFIYLKGVANTVRGTWVTYNLDDGTTTRLAANAIGPVGIAMAATVADRFGWYQISGKAVGLALSGYADNALVWATATAGSVDDTIVDGDMVHLAKGASAVDTPSAGLAEFEISRPYVDDINSND